MSRLRLTFASCFVFTAYVLVVLPALDAQEGKVEPKKGPDLSEFKTVETAITTKIPGTPATQVGSPAYLGVYVSYENGKVVVSDVEDASPAAKAGVKVGDVITQLDGKAVKNAEVFRSLVQTHSSGEKLQITVERKKENVDLTAALIATSRVMTASQKRAVMGVQFENADNSGAAKLTNITAGQPADKAGLKVGDIILKINDKALSESIKIGRAHV